MMKVRALFILGLISPTTVFADMAAIETTNYSVETTYTNFHGNSYGIQGRAAMPLGKYFGVVGTAGADRSNYDNDYIDSHGLFLGGTAFVGSPDTGRIGLNYLKSKTDYDSYLGGFEIDSDMYALNLGVYIDNITLGLTRGFTKSSVDVTSVSLDENANHSLISASYYYKENYKIELSAGGMDAEDINSLSFEFVPKIFGMKAGIGISYIDIPDDHMLSVSFVYYFTDSVSLIDRDRRY